MNPKNPTSREKQNKKILVMLSTAAGVSKVEELVGNIDLNRWMKRKEKGPLPSMHSFTVS